MNTPHDTESGPAGPGGQEPGEHGPRVTRDEVRDLARIRRSRTDRKVAGVAAGVAYHLDVDPLLVRIAFVVLTFFGGGGLILYGVAWLILPDEHTGVQVIPLDDGLRTAVLIIAGILAVASMIGDTFGGSDGDFGLGPFLPWPVLIVALVMVVVFGGKARKSRLSGPPFPFPPSGPASGLASDSTATAPTYPGYRPGPPPMPRLVDPKRRGPLLFPFTVALAALAVGVVGTLHLAGVDVAPSAYPATVLGVVGLMLLVGAFYGRAGGLILVGLVAAAATAITSVVGQIDAGQIHRTPDSAAELTSGYELGVGEIIIDLTKLDKAELQKLDGDSLKVDLGVGHIDVIVPKDGLAVDVDASIAVGEINLFGEKSDSDRKDSYGDPDEPTLTINADLFVGQIDVLTEKSAS